MDREYTATWGTGSVTIKVSAGEVVRGFISVSPERFRINPNSEAQVEVLRLYYLLCRYDQISSPKVERFMDRAFR